MTETREQIAHRWAKSLPKEERQRLELAAVSRRTTVGMRLHGFVLDWWILLFGVALVVGIVVGSLLAGWLAWSFLTALWQIALDLWPVALVLVGLGLAADLVVVVNRRLRRPEVALHEDPDPEAARTWASLMAGEERPSDDDQR